MTQYMIVLTNDKGNKLNVFLQDQDANRARQRAEHRVNQESNHRFQGPWRVIQ